MNRRRFLASATLLTAPFLGGATTSIDLGGGTRRDSLLIAGSDEFHPYVLKLTERFSAAHPLIDVVVEAGGTDPGLLALKRGAIDLALASRDLTAAEDDKQTRAYPAARDAVALVAHPANGVENLSRDQAAGLFRGELADWAKLGAAPGPVHLLRRKPDTGTQKALERLVLNNAEIAPQAKAMDSGVKMREAVAADPLALGFLSLHDITPAVKVLAINAVPMDRTTILSGRYPYTRSFFLVSSSKPGAAVEQYLAFALGATGQAALAELGLIPVR